MASADKVGLRLGGGGVSPPPKSGLRPVYLIRIFRNPTFFVCRGEISVLRFGGRATAQAVAQFEMLEIINLNPIFCCKKCVYHFIL